MKFVFSDKNRSINSFLNFLYFFFVSMFVGILAYQLSLNMINGWILAYQVNSLKFLAFCIFGFGMFYLPLFLKKFFLLKMLAGIPFAIFLSGLFDAISNFIKGNSFHHFFIVLFFLFCFVILLFFMANFKEKYFQKNN